MSVEKIAFLLKGTGQPVYWRTVFLFLGALVFFFVLIGLRALRRGRLLRALLAAPLLGAGALYAARLLHWYCRTEDYAGISAALGDLRTGGFSLAGAFMGALAAAAVLALIKLIDDLPAFLDDAAAAAAAGVAVGRLGDMYGLIDHGRILVEDAARQTLPWASPVYNAVSGAYEWRFATFCFQSIWAAVILLAVIAVLLRRKKSAVPDGTAAELFLMLYCLGQILFDSTRYDALFLRSNGFVSMEQIVCCAALLAVLIARSRRGMRVRGFSPRFPLSWLGFLAGMGLTGYMEYYVQRHGGEYVFAYNLMAAGLTIVLLSLLFVPAAKTEKSKRPL